MTARAPFRSLFWMGRWTGWWVSRTTGLMRRRLRSFRLFLSKSGPWPRVSTTPLTAREPAPWIRARTEIGTGIRCLWRPDNSRPKSRRSAGFFVVLGAQSPPQLPPPELQLLPELSAEWAPYTGAAATIPDEKLGALGRSPGVNGVNLGVSRARCWLVSR